TKWWATKLSRPTAVAYVSPAWSMEFRQQIFSNRCVKSRTSPTTRPLHCGVLASSTFTTSAWKRLMLPESKDFDMPLAHCPMCNTSRIVQYDHDFRGCFIYRCQSCE